MIQHLTIIRALRRAPLLCVLLFNPSYAAEPAAESSRWQIELAGGGRVVGELAVREFTLRTEFGTLTVPTGQVHRLTPGLVSRPETERRVLALVEQLGSPMFDVRERAQRELAT